MSSKITIVLTADNEHIYFDCNEPLITSAGERKDAITVEVDMENARVECCDDYDLVFTLTNPDSEIYALFERIDRDNHLKAANERLRTALSRIITAYNENEPDLVHYDELYEVVGQVKNALK